MSYSDWKQTEQKKKEEEIKNRPLTDADFPPLGGNVVTVKKVVPGTGVNVAGAPDGVNLAERLRNAIKRQEDDALRRRLEQEEEEQKAKESMVSLSIGPSIRSRKLENVRRNLEAEAEEENYRWQVSSEIEEPEH